MVVNQPNVSLNKHDLMYHYTFRKQQFLNSIIHHIYSSLPPFEIIRKQQKLKHCIYDIIK